MFKFKFNLNILCGNRSYQNTVPYLKPINRNYGFCSNIFFTERTSDCNQRDVYHDLREITEETTVKNEKLRGNQDQPFNPYNEIF